MSAYLNSAIMNEGGGWQAVGSTAGTAIGSAFGGPIGGAIGGTLGGMLGGMGSNASAKAAAKHQAKMQAIQNEIAKSQALGNAYIAVGNMQREVYNTDSTTNVVAAAQGRRADEGSVKTIKDERTRMLDKESKRVIDTANATGQLLDINTMGTMNNVNAANQARDNQFTMGMFNNMSNLMAKQFFTPAPK